MLYSSRQSPENQRSSFARFANSITSWYAPSSHASPAWSAAEIIEASTKVKLSASGVPNALTTRAGVTFWTSNSGASIHNIHNHHFRRRNDAALVMNANTVLASLTCAANDTNARVNGARLIADTNTSITSLTFSANDVVAWIAGSCRRYDSGKGGYNWWYDKRQRRT